ncbi:DUF2000 domain-containing protein [Achromobacter xylosoxidans]|nr:DUF2000 domain-containing protein [Achromobacter xylosoxidans]MBK1982225.1 DUF2000 family protein [Achromobacter xylosoxidans]
MMHFSLSCAKGCFGKSLASVCFWPESDRSPAGMHQTSVCSAISRASSTGHHEANRAVFRAQPADDLDPAGIALRGPKKAMDRAVKGLSLHP